MKYTCRKIDRGKDNYVDSRVLAISESFPSRNNSTVVRLNKKLLYNETYDFYIAISLPNYKKIPKNKNFYFIDTGYMGNWRYPTNPKGKKLYFRVVKNAALNSNPIIKRPPDRFKSLKLAIRHWRTKGKHILVCPPTPKFMSAENININHKDWIENTIQEIKKHTNRPIKIRIKPPSRKVRMMNDKFADALSDVFAVVTYNSIVAIESAINGVPVFTLGPNAADHIACKNLSEIETPLYPDRVEWLYHLAYCQFTDRELWKGYSWKYCN